MSAGITVRVSVNVRRVDGAAAQARTRAGREARRAGREAGARKAIGGGLVLDGGIAVWSWALCGQLPDERQIALAVIVIEAEPLPQRSCNQSSSLILLSEKEMIGHHKPKAYFPDKSDPFWSRNREKRGSWESYARKRKWGKNEEYRSSQERYFSPTLGTGGLVLLRFWREIRNRLPSFSSGEESLLTMYLSRSRSSSTVVFFGHCLL